jgi:hypothetical protein
VEKPEVIRKEKRKIKRFRTKILRKNTMLKINERENI